MKLDTKIFDTLLEPTFLLDSNGQIVYCNEPAALLTDLSVRKIMRVKPVFAELFKFEVPIQNLDNITSIADSTPYQEVKFTTESGREGKVQVTLQPFDFVDNQAQSWLVYFRDVTLEETLQKKYRKELEQKEGYIRELEDARAKLEDYSKNLEIKVAERTAELSKMNQLMGALLDSLGQGFFIFDQNGHVLEVASKACQNTIEKDPRGMKIWDVLGLEARRISGFQKWISTVFAEMLPFEDLAPLGPPRYNHSEGKEIELQYCPLRTESGAIEGVVVVATDVTSLMQAKREAELERSHVKMILQLLKNKRQVGGFIRESESMLIELNHEMQKSVPDAEITFRLLHTLKGGAATFSVKRFADLCHTAETLLTDWKNLRDEEVLETLRRQCSELPGLFRTFLQDNELILGNTEKLNERWVEAPIRKFHSFADEYLPHQDRLHEIFFQQFLFEPAAPLFATYFEMAQNLAESLGKSLNPVVVETPDFKILPEPYETLVGTFIHAFRNAVDHGIETPEVREQRGKSAAGELRLRFDRKGDLLCINLKDDGNGIDPQIIRDRLKSKGRDVDHESDWEIIQHVFDSQFSTRDLVSDISGRGVGMDAIAQAARQLGGRVWVESVIGKGTQLFVEVPWIECWKKQPIRNVA